MASPQKNWVTLLCNDHFFEWRIFIDYQWWAFEQRQRRTRGEGLYFRVQEGKKDAKMTPLKIETKLQWTKVADGKMNQSDA